MRIGTILVLLINDTANTVYHSEVLTAYCFSLIIVEWSFYDATIMGGFWVFVDLRRPHHNDVYG